ncbi:MAG: YeeE/YedE family protein, partial [Saprospiraceae bacterium]
MKYLKYLLIGIFFGIIMTKSEAISWYRIQEMFRFQSFHMYGIIGTALVVGVVLTAMIKKFQMRSLEGGLIQFKDKNFSVTRYLAGG